MSFFIFENFKAYEVNTYLIEVFEPKKVEFGINLKSFNNSKFYEINDSLLTISKIKNDYFLIAMGEGNEVGFTVISNIDKYASIADIIEFEYLIKNPINNNALNIFNSMFYIYLELMKQYKISQIKFKGENTRLQELYSKLLKNEKLKQYLNNIGLELIEDNKYIVVRKIPSWKR